MKAVRFHGYGGADQVRYEEAETPQPGPDEVLVKMASTSLNPIDWKIRSGALKAVMPIQFPIIPGRDVAGTVAKVGANVRNLREGQRVIGVVNGSFAEYVAAKADDLTVLPDGVNFEDSAALPLVTTTGGQLIQRMQLKRGDHVLVTGAVGGVGRSAVYLAKQMGAHVLAGVRKAQRDEASGLGVERVVAIDDGAEISQLPELDAIADTVNGEVMGKLVPKVKAGGVVGTVLVKPVATEGKQIRVEQLLSSPDASLLRQMADAVRDGKLVIPIARRMKLSEAAEALAMGEKGSAGGKILLTP